MVAIWQQKMLSDGHHGYLSSSCHLPPRPHLRIVLVWVTRTLRLPTAWPLEEHFDQLHSPHAHLLWETRRRRRRRRRRTTTTTTATATTTTTTTKTKTTKTIGLTRELFYEMLSWIPVYLFCCRKQQWYKWQREGYMHTLRAYIGFWTIDYCQVLDRNQVRSPHCWACPAIMLLEKGFDLGFFFLLHRGGSALGATQKKLWKKEESHGAIWVCKVCS